MSRRLAATVLSRLAVALLFLVVLPAIGAVTFIAGVWFGGPSPSTKPSTVVEAASFVAGAPATAHAQLLSPGPLSNAHRSLEGDQRCNDCHSSGKKVGNAQCNRCHGDIANTIRNGTGLHGRKYKSQECASCHVEHRGRGTQLVRWPQGNAKNFPHADTGYALNGGHRNVKCNDCHKGRNSRGAPTYLGLDRRCKNCHKDEHQGRLGERCEDCHSDVSWKTVAVEKFDHNKARYPLKGAHQSVKCVRCHGTPSKWTGIPFDKCTACHEDPHKGRFGEKCENCHTVQSFKDISGMRANHPGLKLSGGHRNVRCERCHGSDMGSKPAKGSRCVSCHKPVHKAPFGKGCEPCHASIRWEPLPREIGLESHDKTEYLLKGRHRDVECASCHSPKLSPQKRYRELTFAKCNDCHRDEHKGEFTQREGGECAPCHNERGFAPTLFGVKAHASTAFELQGRHQAVPCGSCHKSERPRLNWRLQASRCTDCHKNPHGDQFAAEMAQGGCAHCHNATGWDRPNIDHRTWPLLGAHSRAACVACHQPTAADRKAGKGASYRGLRRDCAGCHTDPHGGQFKLTEPRKECDHCHGNETFELPKFEHAKLTGYPLEGKHAAAECTKCHAEVKLRNGEKSIRWRLGYRECRDCHADPHAGASP